MRSRIRFIAVCVPLSSLSFLGTPRPPMRENDEARIFVCLFLSQVRRADARNGRAGAHASSDIASQCSLCSGDMRTP